MVVSDMKRRHHRNVRSGNKKVGIRAYAHIPIVSDDAAFKVKRVPKPILIACGKLPFIRIAFDLQFNLSQSAGALKVFYFGSAFKIVFRLGVQDDLDMLSMYFVEEGSEPSCPAFDLSDAAKRKGERASFVFASSRQSLCEIEVLG